MARQRSTKARTNAGAVTTATTRQSASMAKSSGVASEQLINQKQSVEVVQTVLHGSISCLAYLRGLFSEDCFDDQFYATAVGTHWSYEDYAAGRLPESERNPKQRYGNSMKVLRRGRHRNVDTFLDWLEHGAFEALRRHVLRAVQLRIFESAEKPADVVETYTFTFRYTGSCDDSSVLADLEMRGPYGEACTIKNARYALGAFIRRLVALCNTLPDLPVRRFLKMQLFYTDDCDPSYEPPGFEKCKDPTIFFPNNDDWQKVTQECGSMNAGFHSISLRVSHLDRTLSDGPSTPGPLRIPQGLQHTAVTTGEDDIDMTWVHELSTTTQAKADAIMARTTETGQQSILNAGVGQSLRSQQGELPPSAANLEPEISQSNPMNEVENQNEDKARTHLNQDELDLDEFTTQNQEQTVSGHIDLSVADSQGSTTRDVGGSDQVSETLVSTQQLEDQAAKLRLQNILEPSDRRQSLEETQPLDSMPQALRRNENIPGSTAKVELSQTKVYELESHKRTHAALSGGGPRRVRESTASTIALADQDIIQCQCGWNEEEDDMINCHFCDTWQHLHCYGYRGSDDPRLPTVHACYKCLLEEKEAPLLRDLQNLTLLRRGMHFLELEGYRNDRTFSQSLRCDLQTAARVFNHIRREGYLVATPGSHGRGFSQTGKPKFNVNRNEPTYSKMLMQYFDPLVKIAHHFKSSPLNLPGSNLSTQLPVPPEESRTAYDTVLQKQDGATLPAQDSYTEQTPNEPNQLSVGRRQALRSYDKGKQPALAVRSLTVGGTTTTPAEDRYHLRRTQQDTVTAGSPLTELDANVAFPLSTPKRKRAGQPDATPRSSRKRMKSSKSRMQIDVGEVSPLPTPGKSYS